MGEKGSPEAFHDYRRWVCAHMEPLLYGDPVFWEPFSNRRERLRNASSPISSLFEWEDPFRKCTQEVWPVLRRKLVEVYGVSRYRLRRYEAAGWFFEDLPGPEGYGMGQVKRLQWILFFQLELGIRTPGLTTLLALKGPRQQLASLSESHPPDVPIHRSHPAPFNPQRKGVDSVQAGPVPEIRFLRERLHEIGNKLHVIAGRGNRLRRKLPDNELAEKNLAIILDQSDKAIKALGDIREMILAASSNHPEGER